MYVSVVGKISVSNSCGVLGKTYTNPTPVAVQAITTASYASWPSSCRPQGSYVDAVIDTLDAADIACPTWGLSDPFYTTCDGDVYLTATSGAPYNPVILVPTQFLGYDPTWDICTKVPTNGLFVLPCGVYDPPRALHRATSMVPAVTGASDPPVTTPPPAVPEVAAQPTLAQPTVTPLQGPQTVKAPVPQPVQSPANSSPADPGSTNNDPQADPSQAASQGQGSSGSAPAADPNQSSNSNDPGQASNNQPAGSQPAPATNDPGQGSNNQPAGSQSPPAAADPQKAAPAPQAIPQTTINIGVTQPSPAIGGIIHSALSGGSPAAQPGNPEGGSNSGGGTGGSSTGTQGGSESGQGGNGQPNAAFTPHAVTMLGQTLSAINPSAVAIAGKTLSAGGPAFSSNGNFYSVGPSGSLVAGTLAPSATPAPVLTFAGSAYTANSASQFVIAGQTLNPGAQIMVSGTPISLAPGSSNVAIIGSSTQALSMITPAPAQPPALLTFDGSTYTANSASQFIVAGQTLNPGQQITVSGTPVSLAPSGASNNFAVIGGSTQSLQSAATSSAQAPALLTFDGSTYTANSASQFVIAGKTLTPGGSVTVFGMPISEGSGGSFAVIGASTQALQTPGMTAVPALMTFDGQTYTANSASDFVIAGQTLTPGGIITVSGTPISEAASGSGIVAIGSSTQVLGHASATTTSPATMTFNGQTYTADAASDFTINGQTLTPGGVITVSGTSISEAASGSGLVVVGSSTQVLGHALAGVTQAAVMTFDGQTFTANAASDFVIDGQTLTPGGMITVSGTPISEAAGATDVVIGTSTEVLSTATISPSAMTFIGGQTKLSVPSVVRLFVWFSLSILSGLSFLA